MSTDFFSLFIQIRNEFRLTLNEPSVLRKLQALKITAGKQNESFWCQFLDAMLFYYDEKYPEALQLFVNLLVPIEKSPSPNHLLIALLLFYKASSLVKMDLNKEAIVVYDEVDYRYGSSDNPEIQAEVAHSLVNKGWILGKIGQNQEAIEVNDEIERRFGSSDNPEFQAVVALGLSNNGVALNQVGHNKEAIAVYEEVERRYGSSDNPEIQTQLARSLYNKGTILDSKESISVCEEVERRYGSSNYPRITRIVHQAVFYRGVCLYRFVDKRKGYRIITQIYTEHPKELDGFFRYFCATNGKDFNKEHSRLFPRSKNKLIPDKDRTPELQGFITTIRSAYDREWNDFVKKKVAFEKKRSAFLEPKSLLDAQKSLWMILRRWNSYTPSIPMEDNEYIRGGGYFLWHKGIGTVIDPGYDFLQNYYDAGGRMCDIDNIVLTHAHNDHTIEFETLLSLLREYNEMQEKVKGKIKKVNLYLNNGSFKKFMGLLNLRHKGHLAKIVTMNTGHHFNLCEGVLMHVVNAFHDEMISRDQSVGVEFDLSFGKQHRRILLTSDTGLFPLREDEEKPTIDLSINKEVWEGYDKTPMDLMVIHIGSIKTEEFDIQVDPKPGTACYPNHLGIIGTARVITLCKPILAVISEFGEEMKSFRKDLIRGLQENVIRPYFKTKEVPIVVPGDLAFVYDIENQMVLGIKGDWVKVQDIDFADVKDTEDYESAASRMSIEELYYFSKRQKIEILASCESYNELVNDFKTDRKRHRGLYFKPAP